MAGQASDWMHWLAGRDAAVDGRYALTRWFAAVGALAIGLFSLGMGWLLSSYLEERMLERDGVALLMGEYAHFFAQPAQLAAKLGERHGARVGAGGDAGGVAGAGGAAGTGRSYLLSRG